MNGVSLHNYKVVKPTVFAYVADTSRRGDKISLAFNDTADSYIVSSITTTFEIKEEAKNDLLPDYLFMFLRRPEFDRYARYNSWGSARETITWEDLGRLEIPVPSIEVQKSVVNIFHELYADVAKLLKKHGYPPRTIDDAYDEIMKQVDNYKQYAD